MYLCKLKCDKHHNRPMKLHQIHCTKQDTTIGQTDTIYNSIMRYYNTTSAICIHFIL